MILKTFQIENFRGIESLTIRRPYGRRGRRLRLPSNDAQVTGHHLLQGLHGLCQQRPDVLETVRNRREYDDSQLRLVQVLLILERL